MPLSVDTVSTADGTCTIIVATPDGDGPWPGVIMYPDAGGARDTFRDMAAELAGHGYVVIVPDVYYREPAWAPFEMATVFGDACERQRLFAMIGKVTPDFMAADAAALFDYLVTRPDVSGERFGTTGYCMGGRISLIVAGRVPDRVAAALSFHGGGLVAEDPGSPHLLADRIRAAVYVGGAENDASFTAAHAKTLDDALSAAGVEHTVEFYAAGHGFAVPDNAPYDQAAAQQHWTATTDFLGRHLR